MRGYRVCLEKLEGLEIQSPLVNSVPLVHRGTPTMLYPTSILRTEKKTKIRFKAKMKGRRKGCCVVVVLKMSENEIFSHRAR